MPLGSRCRFRGRTGVGHTKPQPLVLLTLVAFVVALVACVHLGLWVLTQDRSEAPNFNGRLPSISYAPYRGTAHPDVAPPSTASDIRADLKLLAPYTRAVRTYSATKGNEL